MDRDAFAARIEHTVLGPTVTWSGVAATLETADRLGMRACVPPCYVAEAVAEAPDVPLATVCAFPHGQDAPETKAAAAERAWRAGADELDVVLNVGRLRGGETDAVRQELADVVAAVPIPVKAIVEAPRLEDEALRTACELAVEADASFLKTATGFADAAGAAVEDVAVMAEYLPVKASGGIGTFDAAVEILEAGASRIGASAGEEILAGFDPERA